MQILMSERVIFLGEPKQRTQRQRTHGEKPKEETIESDSAGEPNGRELERETQWQETQNEEPKRVKLKSGTQRSNPRGEPKTGTQGGATQAGNPNPC